MREPLAVLPLEFHQPAIASLYCVSCGRLRSPHSPNWGAAFGFQSGLSDLLLKHQVGSQSMEKASSGRKLVWASERSSNARTCALSSLTQNSAEVLALPSSRAEPL